MFLQLNVRLISSYLTKRQTRQNMFEAHCNCPQSTGTYKSASIVGSKCGLRRIQGVVKISFGPHGESVRQKNYQFSTRVGMRCITSGEMRSVCLPTEAYRSEMRASEKS